jgi:large subunit ribosomal protein L24e
MVKCSFCGNSIEKGTGKMFVYASGKVLNFCKMKCEKNMLKLKRKPLHVRWTQEYRKENKKEDKKENKAEKVEKNVGKESGKV